jgi:HTH-type transcriptional regulator / antitoxin HigA
MSVAQLESLSANSQVLAPLVAVPRSEAEFARLSAMLDGLTDAVGEDESHPLASLMDVVGTLVEAYENEHIAELA